MNYAEQVSDLLRQRVAPGEQINRLVILLTTYFILDTMGWIFYKMGEFEKAKRFIKASIDLNADEASAEVLEHLGDVYDKLNNIDEAKKIINLNLISFF